MYYVTDVTDARRAQEKFYIKQVKESRDEREVRADQGGGDPPDQ